MIVAGQLSDCDPNPIHLSFAELLKNVFIKLFDVEIISKEAFNAWKSSTKQPEGKGVAEKMLANFFLHMSDIGSDEDSPVD